MFAALLLMSIQFRAHAQEHQVSAGVGVLSTNQIADVFFNVAQDMISELTGSDADLENRRSVGEFRVGYAYHPIERVSVGATFSYLQTIADAVTDGTVTGDYKSQYLTFAAEGTFYYLSRENIRLYGLLGAGLTNLSSDYRGNDRNANVFNLHVTPIGIAFGNRFGGTAEIGFGYRGVFSLGLFYKL